LSQHSTSEGRHPLILVEDDAALRRALQLLLHNQGFDVRAYPSAANILAEGNLTDDAVLLADYRLPDSDGVAIVAQLRARGWRGRAVMLTGFPSAALTQSAIDAGYSEVLEKPIPHHRLLAALRRLDHGDRRVF